jgi:hypothetical protein
MARAGMANLITEVRSLCNLGTADYTVGVSQYWTDNQIKDVLDRHSVRVQRELLESESEWATGGSAIYQNYRFKESYPEEAASGTTVWLVQNGDGSAILPGTATYSVNYEQRRIHFVNDQAGEARYLSYYSFDVFRAAAEIWNQKASHVADRFDIATDNHDLKRSQLIKHYQQRARDMLIKAKIGKMSQGRQIRSDLR